MKDRKFDCRQRSTVEFTKKQGGIVKAIVTHKRGVTVVSFEGNLDFGYALTIKEKLRDLAKKHKKIVFNLEKLAFVGSAGFKPFIKTLQSFYKHKPRYCGLKEEYLRLFKAYKTRPLAIFENEKQACGSFNKSR